MPVLLLAAFATGIAMVRIVATWDITGLGTVTALLLLAWLFVRRSPWASLPLCGILLLTGLTSAARESSPPLQHHHISHLAGDHPLSVEARVVSLERRGTGGYRLVAEALRVFETDRVRQASGRVLLYIEQGKPHSRPGQIIRWRTKLRRPYRFGNPGEFDYPLYLASRGIYVTGYIHSAEELVALINHPRQQSALLANLRLDLAEAIRSCVPEEQAGLLQSLLLGLRGGIQPEQRDILAESGIAHLFAISGLHYGLLALLLYRICRWFYSRSTSLLLRAPPQQVLPVFLLVPLAGYLVLTGNAWATRRAFLMVGVVALQLAYGRRTSNFSLLASVALCILICDPLALFQPGFQLSFAGVAGILAWLPSWQGRLVDLPGKFRWPLLLSLTTLAATLATTPAALWHFHQFAPAGLLANLIAVPLIAWGAVPLGLAGMAVLPLAAPCAEWLILMAAWVVDTTMAWAAGISQAPWLNAIPVYLTPAKLVLLIGTLVTILPFPSLRYPVACRICILLMTALAAAMLQIHPPDFRVVALSVGQGDATLLSLQGDLHYLVDGGGLPGSDIDPGQRLIAPALGRMGIGRLDGVILTHNHPDHASGLVYMLENFPVERFYHAAEFSTLAAELQAALRQSQVRTVRVDTGWSYIWKNARQELSIFVPDQSASDINERSIAVYAQHLGRGVMLTADLGEEGLRQIVAGGVPGNVSLLKLPHHGSRHAAPERFLARFAPAAAFVSAGRGNPYGFPHLETTEACLKRRIPLYRTDLMGMLDFRIQGQGWQVRQGHEKSFRID